MIKNFPTDSGIYKMKDASGEIIYIGKAKNLKQRLKSYFSLKTDLKTKILVSKIESIEYIVTRNEQEALILENQLIKKNQPKYNINLKDDKNYPYIKIETKKNFPAIVITRQKIEDGNLYFGPYPSIGSTKNLKKILYDLFPLKDCKQAIKPNAKKYKKCLKYDMHKCLGPCLNQDIKKDYDEQVQALICFLKGHKQKVLAILKTKMQQAALEKKYELAIVWRDQIQKIKALFESTQFVDLDTKNNFHIWAMSENEDYYYVLSQEIVQGKLISQKGVYKEKKEVSLKNFLEQAILTFYNDKKLPDKIITDSSLASLMQDLLTPYFKNISKKIKTPQKGDKKKLLNLAETNTYLGLNKLWIERKTKQLTTPIKILKSLKQKLNLVKLPKKIIGFDVSHLSGEGVTGSAVYFENGKPQKKLYRHFLVKSVKNNDPQAMYEIVLRRLDNCLKEKNTLPNLLLIDGGSGQLTGALTAVKSLLLEKKVQVIALAKKEEKIFIENKKQALVLDRKGAELKLLQQIRNEAHRFAKKLQTKQRNDLWQKSILKNIKGIGPKRLNSLYITYKNIADIAKIKVEDLAKVDKMGKKIANSILERIKCAK